MPKQEQATEQRTQPTAQAPVVPLVKDVITYNKGVQTTLDEPVYPPSTNDARESEETIIARLRLEIESEVRATDVGEQDTTTESATKTVDIPELAQDEKASLLRSEAFAEFLDRSAKVVERALNDDYDITTDYGKGFDASEAETSKSQVKQVGGFHSEQWSKKRIITSIDWSRKFPELVLASYSKNVNAPQEPDGLIQVWNMHMSERPEYVFHSQVYNYSVMKY